MKQYRLLRSNKESGPYSAEELIQMGLKAYDLIWVDGKSAAWRYPSEMDEFKNFAPGIEEQPFDRFYKKNTTNTASNIISTTNTSSNVNSESNATVSTTEKITTATPLVTTTLPQETPAIPKEKPRIKIRADWKKMEPAAAEEKPAIKEKISPPAESALQTYPINTPPPSPSWKNAWQDWEQVKKTSNSQEDSANAKTFNKPELETKFSQSLDDIKERYVETVLKPKAQMSSGQFKNLALTAVLAIVVAAVAYGLWNNWNKKDETSGALIGNTKSAEPEKNIQPTSQAQDNIAEDEEINSADDDTKTYIIPVQHENTSADGSEASEKTSLQNQPSNGSAANNKKSNLENNSTLKKSISETPSSANKKLVTSTPVDKTNPLSQKNQPKHGQQNLETINVSPEQNTQPVVNKSAPEIKDPSSLIRRKAKSQSITDFVSVDLDNKLSPRGIENYIFRLQNISEVPLELVVMDVLYFDPGGRFRKGETVYVKNIAAGKAINIKIPDDKLSGKVTYKVALVSAPQKDVYLIAD